MNEEQIIEDNGFADFMMEQEIKKQLIKLAQEKGFESAVVSPHFKEPIYFYLWMCELQKWLRDEHKIILEIEFYDYDAWSYHIYSPTPTSRGNLYQSDKEPLESGLIEALKLI